LDVARNFHGKDTVKKLLDLMSFYKLNRLHWHLTDDEGWRFEVAQLPELTKVGGRRGHTLNDDEFLMPSHGSGPDANSKSSAGNGFYSRSDMVEILRYAAERHIGVVPEIDLPGHARAAIKAMAARNRSLSSRSTGSQASGLLLQDTEDRSKYESVQLWRDNVVDVCRDDIYQFLSIVATELAAIYKDADAPLTMIHLGGDEVPNGAWDEAPSCKAFGAANDSKIPRRVQLELHFLKRAAKVLSRYSIEPGCWEDCLVPELGRSPNAGTAWRAAGEPTPTVYVWNNVWGWGREDAAYQLANAGFNVVLCNATHLYFDLACEKDPLETGYYWAGFVDARKPFEFVPQDVFLNAERNSMGQLVTVESLSAKTRLTEEGERHVLGIQGQLWSENLRSSRDLEYMAFPRLIALAERAWAKSPTWTSIKDVTERRDALGRDWNQFANRLGQRELPRLDWLYGGVEYRLPPPGAVVRNGLVLANIEFPGLAIRCTIDGSDPDQSSPLFAEPLRLTHEIKLKSFDTRGRGGRTTIIRRGQLGAQ
jgi:hexosaminidase